MRINLLTPRHPTADSPNVKLSGVQKARAWGTSRGHVRGVRIAAWRERNAQQWTAQLRVKGSGFPCVSMCVVPRAACRCAVADLQAAWHTAVNPFALRISEPVRTASCSRYHIPRTRNPITNTQILCAVGSVMQRLYGSRYGL